MAAKGPGIYFNRKTMEVVSRRGYEENLDLRSWVRVSDDPTLRLLAVRELLLEKGLITDGRSVYWSGFRTSDRDDHAGAAVGATFATQTERGSEAGSARHRRGGGSAVRRLLRSILGSRTAF